MKKTIYPLLSVCCLLVVGLTAPRFASAELSSDIDQRYENGASYNSIGCPSGMCGDYSDTQNDPAWPVSHQTESEVIYVEEESSQSQNENEQEKIVYEEENQPVEQEEIYEEQQEETYENEDDIYEEEYEDERPAPAPKSSVAKYYMKFDIGIGIKESEAVFKPIECGNGTSLACDPNNDEKQTFVEGSYGGAFSKGIGLGVNINSFLRFDATLTERSDFTFDENLSMRGSTAHFDTSDPDDGTDPDTLYDESMTVDNSIQNLTAMASLYIDFFRRYSRDETGRISRSGISPYIGAGIGYSKNTMQDMTGDFIAYYEHSDASIHHLDGLWRLQGSSASGLAWMATAGLNFALSERTWLDISYKFLNLGNVESSKRYTITIDTDINNNGISGDDGVASGDSGDADIDGEVDAFGNPADPGYMEYDNAGAQEFELEVHEVSIGLRYEF